MTAGSLWTKYRPLALRIAGGYYLPGAERQDVEQEALIGLWVASCEWKPDGGASFTSFARLVITRRLDTCVRLAHRDKHQVLNGSVREFVTDDGFSVDAAEALPCLHQVTDRVEDREQLRAVLRAIEHDLSDLERHCVIGIAQGLSYAEIGLPSQVDNALMRARRKLRAAA